MSKNKNKLFNRVDTIKDATAKAEIARAHTMVALLGAICIALIWVLNCATTMPLGLVVLATALLALVVLFSAMVAYSMTQRK